MLAWSHPPAPAGLASEAARALLALRDELQARDGALHGGLFEDRLWQWGGHKRGLVQGGALQWTCYWCERALPLQRELRVDHARPKAELGVWKRSPEVLVQDRPPEIERVGRGYWWLAYDWQNWLLSCMGCNEGWKRTLFPVEGAATEPVEGQERWERPLLLLPGLPFEVGEHFDYDPAGLMLPRTPQARATLHCCGLNRPELVAERLRVYKDAHGARVRLVEALRRGGRLDEPRGELVALGSRGSAFAGMVRWLAQQHLKLRWEEWAES